MSNHYDMIIIGSGPAGESAAELAAYSGYRVAMIERGKPGGTATTRGSVPTKTLREAALALTGFYPQEVYGVELGAPPASDSTMPASRWTSGVILSLTKSSRRASLGCTQWATWWVLDSRRWR